LAVVLLGAGAWVGLHWSHLQAWRHARALAGASDEERSARLERLAELGEAAIPPLVSRLHSPDEAVCDAAGRALTELARRWGSRHVCGEQLARQLVAAFPDLPCAGQRHALIVASALVTAAPDEAPDDSVMLAAGQLLGYAAKSGAEELRPPALNLAVALLYPARPLPPELLLICRTLATSGLKDTRAACRAAAVRLAAAPGMEMLQQLVPLVSGPTPDPAGEVRALALLALTAHDELLATDELLPFLHDPSEAVRGVCERILQSRGLTPTDIQLARRMTDPHPGVRAKVPAQVFEFPDLDTRVWLERLSRDPSPAVRAAVLRASCEFGETRMYERLREMAETDPDQTVRQIAEHYFLQMSSGINRR
jgi:hypothetical protein